MKEKRILRVHLLSLHALIFWRIGLLHIYIISKLFLILLRYLSFIKIRSYDVSPNPGPENGYFTGQLKVRSHMFFTDE